MGDVVAENAAAEVKRANRQVWAAGDWDEVADLIAAVGPALLDRVGIEPGIDVLDVGTGSGGSVSVPAALRGARVVGSDLTPQLLDAARRRASEAGVEVDWVEADAEALPFEDATFDRVLSTFGHMFAPRHAVAAAELVRVCRPGGIVGLCTWTPDGFGGSLFKVIGAHMPPPPDFVESPALWGSEDHVRELLEPHGLELEFDRDTVSVTHPSVEELVAFYEEKFGPIMTAKAVLGEAWPPVRSDLVAAFETFNGSDDGSARIEGEYLVTIARKRA